MNAEKEETVVTALHRGNNIWKRGLMMVFFAIVMRIVELALGVVMLAQFVAKLVTGRAISRLTEFGESVAQYTAQIVRFQTFVTEERPYPFAAWPGANANPTPPGATRADAASETNRSSDDSAGSPNPA